MGFYCYDRVLFSRVCGCEFFVLDLYIYGRIVEFCLKIEIVDF